MTMKRRVDVEALGASQIVVYGTRYYSFSFIAAFTYVSAYYCVRKSPTDLATSLVNAATGSGCHFPVGQRPPKCPHPPFISRGTNPFAFDALAP